MIEGLKVVLDGKDLSAHCEERARHHSEKAAKYRTIAEGIRGNAPATSVNNSPLDDFERRAERHETSQHYFLFLADHIDLAEQYNLSEEELVTLELIGRNYIQ